MTAISPTPFADVNAILDRLLTEVRRILGGQLVGMYLYGSLANGGFDEHSDIDVLFVTDEALTEDTFSRLQAMHKEMAKTDSPWAVQLEVSYIPQAALRRFDRSNILHPHLDRGEGEDLHMMAHESDWIVQRHILRERGVILKGPDLKALIDPISPADLKQAVADVLPLWTDPILDDPSRISKRGYQSFCVLSLCRMLYTLRYGKILSKQDAAQWGKINLEASWAGLIDRALVGRQNSGLDAQPEDIEGTLNMMRYALQHIKPTPYPEINEILNLLLARARTILKDEFVGMYLYGSLSSGGFDPQSSDIDFLVVTAGSLSAEIVAELESMHQRIWASELKWASKLEGCYVPKEVIRRHDTRLAPCPTVNEGRFYVAGLGSDWIIQRHIVREQGIVLAGPEPKTLIDRVSPDDIRGAVRGILEEWWFPMLDDPSWLADRESEYRAFAILTMCRALHAVEHGGVVSKTAAARWAQAQLGEEWRPVIERALLSQRPGRGKIELLSEALELIRYTRGTIRR